MERIHRGYDIFKGQDSVVENKIQCSQFKQKEPRYCILKSHTLSATLQTWATDWGIGFMIRNLPNGKASTVLLEQIPVLQPRSRQALTTIAASIRTSACLLSPMPAEPMPHTFDRQDANNCTVQLLLILPQEKESYPDLVCQWKQEKERPVPSFWCSNLQYIWGIVSRFLLVTTQAAEKVVLSFPVSVEAFPWEGVGDGWLTPYHHKRSHYVCTGP